MGGTQVTWERSLELVAGAEKTLSATRKLVDTGGSGALNGLDDLLNMARAVFRQACDEEDNAFIREANERKAAAVGMENQIEMPMATDGRTMTTWKNDQSFEVLASEDGEATPSVRLKPGEEMTCFDPAKVRWVLAETPQPAARGRAGGSVGRKSSRVPIESPEASSASEAPPLEEVARG